MTMRLLPERLLVRTGPVDHADWNYRPLLGRIQRKRFHLIVDLLGSRRYRRMLEVGYGSGVFLPELAKHCDDLHGIDVHDKPEAVGDALNSVDVGARLHTGSVTALPYDTASFDCVVAVSALEYVDAIDEACRELCRILTPEGCLVMVTPGVSPVVDAGLKLLTGESARANYDKRRQALRLALDRHFDLGDERHCPSAGGALLRLYTALRLVPSHAE